MKSDPDRWPQEVFADVGVFDRLTITFVATVPYPADPDTAATRRKQFAVAPLDHLVHGGPWFLLCTGSSLRVLV